MKKAPEKGMKGNGSLARTLSTRSGITVFVCLLVIGAVLLFMVAHSVRALLDSSFTQITETNAAKIKEKMYASERDNELIADYIKLNYNQILADSTNAGAMSSIMENTPLTVGAKSLENYLIGSLQSITKSNTIIQGIGVFFEPYMVDPNVEHYGLYILKKEGSETETEKIYADATWTKQYYIDTIKTGKAFMTSPYVGAFDTKVFTITTPIVVDGRTIGIMLADLKLDELAKIDFRHQNNKTFMLALVNQNDEMMFHSKDSEAMGKPFLDRVPEQKARDVINKSREGDQAFRLVVRGTDKIQREVFFYPIMAAGQKWWVYSAVEKSDFYSQMNSLIAVTVILLLLAVVILIVTMLIQIRKSLKPLDELVIAGEALQEGNLGYKIQYSGDNEIGRVCTAMQEAFINLENVIGEISTALKGLSEGDLTYMPKQIYVGEFEEIKTSYLRLLEGLNAGFRKIKVSATQISDGADQVSQGAQSLSQSSTQQAASLEELSATIGDITGKINLNAKSADEANELSDQIGDAIEISNAHMNDLMNAMEKMTEASSEVNKIIKTIDDIAFQTNILALNAAVEAARAGEAGKGFAVVADEVRNLASKSATAAKSTTELIETSINAVAEGKEIAEKTAQSLDLVVQNANTITVKIREILTSSEEQAVSASQINLGADQISSAVQTNSATSEESAAASEELASQANILDTLIAQYKMLDDYAETFAKADIQEVKTDITPNSVNETVEVADVKPVFKQAEKTFVKPLEKPVEKAIPQNKEKPVIKPVEKPIAKTPEKSIEKPMANPVEKVDESEKTREILAYESKTHDISQVKELHASTPESIEEPTIHASENGGTKHTEISDFDNKYV